MEEQSKSYTTERGDKFWYLPSKGMGHWHRLDGPALEYKDGTKEWWVDDKRHRLDGPAIKREDGTKSWWVDDKLHRLDGPAVEDANGSKYWFVDGKRHRLDGPAIEYKHGLKYWFVDNKLLSTEEVEEWIDENNIDLSTNVGQVAFKLRWL